MSDVVETLSTVARRAGGPRMRNLGTVVVAVLLAGGLVAGCSAAEPDPAPVPPAETSPSVEPSGSVDASGVTLARLELDLEPVARGLDQPLWLTHAGDGSGRLFIAEQTGRVRVWRDGEVLDTPYLDVARLITSGGERGLLGLAFAPDFEKTGRFYVDYTDRNGDTVVARYIADDPASDAPRLTGPTTMFTVQQPFANHNGGCIMFGPDGMLWVGMGDGGSGGDPNDNAQNPRSRLGKMLVVDVAEEDPGAPEIRYLGLRNPWRFSFDRETGDLWIGDVGQNKLEEIDFVRAADLTNRLNFGWNRWEGSSPFEGGREDRRDGFVFPIVEYGRDDGQSVTGGYVYRGSRYPALTGTYLYADFSAGWIGGVRQTDSQGRFLASPSMRRLIEGAGSVASFGEDEDGELYVVDLGGTVFQVVARER